ncbi:MAG: hypothetical protein ABF289_18055 [Clostridiales bacterium]
MNIKKNIVKGEIEVKRFYLEGVKLSAPCPKCKKVIQFDNSQYISYPKLNKKEIINIFCEKCDDFFEVEIKLILKVEKYERKKVEKHD